MRKDLIDLAWSHLVAYARGFNREIMPVYADIVLRRIADMVDRAAVKGTDDGKEQKNKPWSKLR